MDAIDMLIDGARDLCILSTSSGCYDALNMRAVHSIVSTMAKVCSAATL